MATGVKTYQVDITSNPDTIIVTAEPVASNVPESFPIAHILQVTPVFYDYQATTDPAKDSQQATYPYPTKTVLVIESHDDKKLSLELQSITNQPTWSGGTLADLQQAASDINTLL
jgi:hypothetical protein